MSNLRLPSIPLSEQTVRRILDANAAPRAATTLQAILGTPRGAALLIERGGRP